jgi:hypothetical protein
MIGMDQMGLGECLFHTFNQFNKETQQKLANVIQYSIQDIQFDFSIFNSWCF